MENGDISNEATQRYWVIEDVVLERTPSLPTQPARKHWWQRKQPIQAPEEVITPALAQISQLWRFTQRYQSSGIRMELVHLGSDDRGEEILALLDALSASPFTAVVSFPTLSAVADTLAFRPDVIGVIDIDNRWMMHGSRGMSLRDVR